MNRKRLARLGGRPVTLDDTKRLNAFTALFKAESDRSAVLLAGAYIESALEAALRLRFVDDKRIDDLFEGTGPLATLKRKD